MGQFSKTTGINAVVLMLLWLAQVIDINCDTSIFLLEFPVKINFLL
jgi:hypothetical protein